MLSFYKLKGGAYLSEPGHFENNLNSYFNLEENKLN
jgi:hypothetical protein